MGDDGDTLEDFGDQVDGDGTGEDLNGDEEVGGNYAVELESSLSEARIAGENQPSNL